MKHTPAIAFILLSTLFASAATGQGLDAPLSIQGMDQFIDVGAKARAMGGAQVGSQPGLAGIFFDPAAIALLRSPEARAGVMARTASQSQRQEWLPNRVYVELSLIMENNPVAVHRPFDDIVPEWDRRETETRPSLIAGAVPFRLGGIRLVGGLGYATVADLDHYFQNNNVLDPNLGRMRPAPVPRVTQGDSLMVNWYQFSRARTGFISAVTPALAAQIGESFTVGASLSLLSGSSDDLERRAGRGRFTLRYNNNLSLAPLAFNSGWSGKSTYSGTFATISGAYATQHLRVGLSVRTPYTLEREWERLPETNSDTDVSREGTDSVEMPLSMSVGISIMPSSRWLLSATFDRKSLDDARYDAAGLQDHEPWLGGGGVRLGAEFRPAEWIALRGGYRDVARTFAPEGAGLMDDPVHASVISAGLGLSRGRFGIDAAYEYARTEYDDRWLSNVNYNEISNSSFVLEAFVRL